MDTAIPIRSRWLCALMALLAAATLAWGQGRGKPPKTQPPPPPNSFLAFDSEDDIWLSDGVTCGLLLADGTCPTWSPDGNWIAFRREDAATGWGIYKAPVDGSAPPTLVTLYPSPFGVPDDMLDWSPCATATGSEMILFACHPPGGGEMKVHAVNADGMGLVMLTTGPGYFVNPRWGANADCFTASFGPVPMTHGFAAAVYHLAFDAEGNLAIDAQTQLTHVPESPIQGLKPAFGPALSHNGVWVVCSILLGGENPDVFKIEVANPANLVRLTFDPDEKHFDPIFSPNDSQVLFTVVYLGNRRLIATVDAGGGSPTPTFLTPGFKGSQWHVDIKP